MKTNYIPSPIDTSKIKLTDDILELAEVLAKNTHEVWSVGKMNEGWSYGPEVNELKKEHPSLIPYEELSDSQKDYDRNTSIETLKVLLALGFEIKKK